MQSAKCAGRLFSIQNHLLVLALTSCFLLLQQRQLISDNPAITPHKLPLEFLSTDDAQLAEAIVLVVEDRGDIGDAFSVVQRAVTLDVSGHYLKVSNHIIQASDKLIALVSHIYLHLPGW